MVLRWMSRNRRAVLIARAAIMLLSSRACRMWAKVVSDLLNDLRHTPDKISDTERGLVFFFAISMYVVGAIVFILMQFCG